jgi:hypothetical protein
MRVLVMTLALAGCAAHGEAGMRPGSDAASLGERRWLITCYNQMSACTQRASALCSGGFDVEQVTPTTQTTGVIGAPMVRKDFHLQVTCRAPHTFDIAP